MCLVLNEKSKVKVATKDIVCWKGVFRGWKENEFESPFHNYISKLGVVHSIPKDFGKTNCLERYHGFAKEHYRVIDECAFHSFKKMRDAQYFADMIHAFVVKCVIPKGSKYIEGKFEQWDSYASESIKYVKDMEPSKRYGNYY